MFGQWMGENRIVLENGFEDDDFEEKFLEWLNSKSEEEILEGMERIVGRQEMIKIDDRFFIDTDEKCYVLKEKSKIMDKKSKNYGEEVLKVCGYYVNLESLLNGFLKVKTREFISGNEKEIKDLVKEIKTQTDYIKKLNLKV